MSTTVTNMLMCLGHEPVPLTWYMYYSSCNHQSLMNSCRRQVSLHRCMYNGYRDDPALEFGEPFMPSVSVDALPDRIDWREKGYDTEVKKINEIKRYCGTIAGS